MNPTRFPPSYHLLTRTAAALILLALPAAPTRAAEPKPRRVAADFRIPLATDIPVLAISGSLHPKDP